MTMEHLQLLLDHPKDLRLFFQVAERLARGQVPQDIQDSVAQGRWRSSRNCGGGHRSKIGCAHDVSTIDGRNAAGNGFVSVCHGQGRQGANAFRMSCKHSRS